MTRATSSTTLLRRFSLSRIHKGQAVPPGDVSAVGVIARRCASSRGLLPLGAGPPGGVGARRSSASVAGLPHGDVQQGCRSVSIAAPIGSQGIFSRHRARRPRAQCCAATGRRGIPARRARRARGHDYRAGSTVAHCPHGPLYRPAFELFPQQAYTRAGAARRSRRNG